MVKMTTPPEELQGIRSTPSVPKEERIHHDLAPPPTDIDPQLGTPLPIFPDKLQDKSLKLIHS